MLTIGTNGYISVSTILILNRKEHKESSSKIKALNDTILRMNEKNVRLTSENKSLKEDMEKLMAQLADTKEKKR